jgi:hypothetical protein
MGGNSSKTFSSTSIFNESLAQVTYDVANKCAANTGISQSLSLRGAKVTNCPITQDASSNVNFQCLQTISFGADFQNKFENIFKEKLNAEIANLGIGSFNSAEATSLTSVTNRVVNSINVASVSSCISDNIINQKLDMDGANVDCTKTGNIAQSATISVLSKCTQNNSNTVSALTEIDNLIQKKIDAASSLTNMIILAVIAIIGLGLIGLITTLVLNSGGSISGSFDDEYGFDEMMARN